MSTDDGDFLFRDETYRLIGAEFEVYNELSCAYNEPLYQEAYEKELFLQSIPFVAPPQLRVSCKGVLLNKESSEQALDFVDCRSGSEVFDKRWDGFSEDVYVADRLRRSRSTKKPKQACFGVLDPKEIKTFSPTSSPSIKS